MPTNCCGRPEIAFGFDQLNRLKQSTVAGASASYAYDGDGVRVGRTIGTSTTTYTNDVATSLPVVLDDGTRTYVWGPGLAYAVTTSGGAIDVSHADGLGSIRALTDGSGAVTQTYEYDAYGTLANTSGSRTQPFGFTGEPRDPTGLVHLRARMYDPSIGRFLSRDSFAGFDDLPLSQNRFTYVEDNPANSTDPSGNNPLLIGCGVGAVIGAAIEGGPDWYSGQKINGSRVLRGAATGCLVGATAVVGGRFLWPVVATIVRDRGMPPIKPGQAGTTIPGPRFSPATKAVVRAENPEGICVYCRMRSGANAQVDHAKPRSRGGLDTPANGQMTCGHCNASKGSRDFPVNPPPGYQGTWPPPWWNPPWWRRWWPF